MTFGRMAISVYCINLQISSKPRGWCKFKSYGVQGHAHQRLVQVLDLWRTGACTPAAGESSRAMANRGMHTSGWRKFKSYGIQGHAHQQLVYTPKSSRTQGHAHQRLAYTPKRSSAQGHTLIRLSMTQNVKGSMTQNVKGQNHVNTVYIR